MTAAQLIALAALVMVALACLVVEIVRFTARRRTLRRIKVAARLTDAQLQLAAQRQMARRITEARHAFEALSRSR